MRRKLVVAILCSFFIPCIISIPAAFAAVGINVTEGVVGTEVTISGLTAGQSYTIEWDGSNHKTGLVSSTGTATFIVPESSGGAHDINVESPSGTSIYSASFTTIPSISIDPTSGIVGTTLTVKGTGFEESEEQVKVIIDDTTLTSGITADSNGSWEKTTALPAASSGNHIIDASGSSTIATAVANRTFVVEPSIAIKPSFGSVGTQVTVSGTGFDKSESDIRFTYGGSEIKSNITADENGSWSSTFSIPQSTKGDHIIDASGSSTSVSDVDDITFSVSSGIAVEPTTVFVGDPVDISGSGFAKDEDNIELYFDGIVMKSDIIADSNGYWYVSFSIPQSVNGSHVFDAGGDTTLTSDVKNASIIVEAQITLRPATGNIGENISVIGAGFSSNQAVDVNYGGKRLPVSPTTDVKGSFTTSFAPLEEVSGQINVQATDIEGVTASATFNMETTAPEPPRIAAPKDGARVGYIGDTKVTFDWTDVTDPSGVFYALQVSDDLDFSTILIDVPKIPDSEYTLTEAESLPPGEYFWRVKAIDKAGNSSDWVRPFVIRTAFIEAKTFAYIILAVVAFIVVVSIVPRVIRRGLRKKDEWGKDIS